MLTFQTPIGESNDLRGTLMYESISGASPLYLSSLSGASGVGVQDNRKTANLKFTHYFDRFSLAAGGSTSTEDDYESNGFVLEGRAWTADRNTILSLSAGGDFDDISSSIDEELDEERRTGNFLLSVTQVVDQNSALQSNISYSTGDGYFSDPYKPFDLRPRSREELSWLLRYVRYIEDFDASLHADYRFFRDTFGVDAHMFELAWYQPFGTIWMIRPSIRYYSQDRADFFKTGRFPTDKPEGFFSADQRLSTFGEWGAGVKVSCELGAGFSFHTTVQGFQQRSGFHFGGRGSDNIEPFYGWFLLTGFTKTF